MPLLSAEQLLQFTRWHPDTAYYGPGYLEGFVTAPLERLDPLCVRSRTLPCWNWALAGHEAARMWPDHVYDYVVHGRNSFNGIELACLDEYHVDIPLTYPGLAPAGTTLRHHLAAYRAVCANEMTAGALRQINIDLMALLVRINYATTVQPAANIFALDADGRLVTSASATPEPAGCWINMHDSRNTAQPNWEHWWLTVNGVTVEHFTALPGVVIHRGAPGARDPHHPADTRVFRIRLRELKQSHVSQIGYMLSHGTTAIQRLARPGTAPAGYARMDFAILRQAGNPARYLLDHYGVGLDRHVHVYRIAGPGDGAIAMDQLRELVGDDGAAYTLLGRHGIVATQDRRRDRAGQQYACEECVILREA